jgi:hypothetical protein
LNNFFEQKNVFTKNINVLKNNSVEIFPSEMNKNINFPAFTGGSVLVCRPGKINKMHLKHPDSAINPPSAWGWALPDKIPEGFIQVHVFVKNIQGRTSRALDPNTMCLSLLTEKQPDLSVHFLAMIESGCCAIGYVPYINAVTHTQNLVFEILDLSPWMQGSANSSFLYPLNDGSIYHLDTRERIGVQCGYPFLLFRNRENCSNKAQLYGEQLPHETLIP